MEMLAACAEEGQRLGVKWKARSRDTFLCVDQMGHFNVAVVAERLSSGHMAIVHVEEIAGTDPFARCSEIIRDYGVRVCVVETLPNFNSAKEFANRHQGVVFLAHYTQSQDITLRWGDERLDRSERRTDEDEHERFKVVINQYKAMQVALARVQDRTCVFPDPKALFQDIAADGKNGTGPTERMPILQDRVFPHLTRVALVTEPAHDDGEKKFRPRVKKGAPDPHFAFAFMLLSVAFSRVYQSVRMLWCEDVDLDAPDPTDGSVVAPMPNPKTARAKQMRAVPLLADMFGEIEHATRTTCATCVEFDEVHGYCVHRRFLTTLDAPACEDHYATA
jgi:hypothetical protein